MAHVSTHTPKSSPETAIRRRGICPISFHDARKFVQAHHSYLAAPRGCIFAIAAYDHHDIVAVAIVGRPVNRTMDDGVTAEISRLCTHEAPPNTASFLIGRILRATRAIGFTRVITYVDEQLYAATWTASNFTKVATTTRRQWYGRSFCVPANAGAKVCRWERREKGHEAAVTAVTSRAPRMQERRDRWASRDLETTRR